MLKAVAGANTAASGITIGTSVITGGTNTRVLFDDNGVVGESAGLTYVKASGLLTATTVAAAGFTFTTAGYTITTGAGFWIYTLGAAGGGQPRFQFSASNGLEVIGLIGITASLAATVIASSVALTNGAGVALGTLATAPTAGNPTKWIGINDNGTIRYVPAW